MQSLDVHTLVIKSSQSRAEMPLILQPSNGDRDLFSYMTHWTSDIHHALAGSGAILFRDFDLRSVQEFERCASRLCSPLFGEYGDLPRETDGAVSYQSTPYPAGKHILFHNEGSHTALWPLKQFFFCVIPAPCGGETPLADCRTVYRTLDPAIRQMFGDKQLLYVRNFVEGLDVSWQDFFRTADRSEVERRCAATGDRCEWLDSETLRVSQVCPAILRHPYTHERLFFNQLQLHHVSRLDPEVRTSLQELLGKDCLPRNVYFGDGSEIPDSVVDEITNLYWEHSVAFPWQAGDVLVLDNMLVAHARNPFAKPRKIVVAMGEMFARDKKAPAEIN